jgi:hypothetical protein
LIVTVEETVRARVAQLIDQSDSLSAGNKHGQCTDERQQQSCSAWLTAAQNVVHLIFNSDTAPYRQKADRIVSRNHGYVIHDAVGELGAVLRSLLHDADAGLLASVADKARAEAFDDFLEHAAAYHRDSRKNEAGVIAGVVFEDTLRRICRKLAITEKGQKLDGLISELSTSGELSAVKAKRARVAAAVRTKASHAQWDEFELEDVRATIDFTRELIAAKLDA